MKITEALKGEHGVFYAQFQFIDNALPDANLATLKALGAMLAAALVPHAQIENDILFPAVEAQIGEGGATQVMRMEHAEIEGKLGQLAELRGMHTDIEGALATKLPTLDNADEARRMLKDILYLAREHFAKEESILFPMADQMLDARTQELLGMDWAERRGGVLA
jgi:iron-sulfur cluster repair protein YtfE (RIC family)